MGYNKDWYEDYEAYLKEHTVRESHDFVFSLFANPYDGHYEDVLDLGCGQSNEFKQYYDPVNYVGIDENTTTDACHIKGNYRDRKLLKSLIDHDLYAGEQFTAFVSLFSSEVHAHYTENYHFYNWLLKTFPNIRAGLVSGLYHSHKKDQNPMIANGNKIYQTLENIEDCRRIGYTERRIVMHVPSKLFGPHEFEVWKIFKRI